MWTQPRAGRGGRPSALAGLWYPAEAQELRILIAELLDAATPELAGRPRILIVPHAGFRFSGSVAAWAYEAADRHRYTRAVVVGQSHHPGTLGTRLYPPEPITTPLGPTAMDVEGMARLRRAAGNAEWGEFNDLDEHAVEIQFPFLQVTLADVPCLPIMMGKPRQGAPEALARALVDSGLLEDGLLVVTSDLSHYHSAARARELDGEAARVIEHGDPEALVESVRAGRTEMCGPGAVEVALRAAKALGVSFRVLRMSDSGGATGETDFVVGYLAAAAMG